MQKVLAQTPDRILDVTIRVMGIQTQKPLDTAELKNHIAEMWGELEQYNIKDEGTLIGLPHPYIVPGGRFEEQFYWDSYFTMLGLAADGRWDMIQNMLDNTAHLIDRFGFVPTANRTYFLSRSQPPVFALMVELLATKEGESAYVKYLPQLKKEYAFWMSGQEKLEDSEHKSFARLAQMPTGPLLNRYYDNSAVPREEMGEADIFFSEKYQGRQADKLFLHLRAAAESGWDFSSRWCEVPEDLGTIHTADIIPIDLNCLLYQLEKAIAKAAELSGDAAMASDYATKAQTRQEAIERYCWNYEKAFYFDYNFHHYEQMMRYTLAAVFPLFVGIANSEQSKGVADRLARDFLQDGGLLTTLEQSGQQWDKPNGWAPLHWVAIKGLEKYGYTDLANTIKTRWIEMNAVVYAETGNLVEKYDVTPGDHLGYGGEYPLQVGFGWTNGVLRALLD